VLGGTFETDLKSKFRFGAENRRLLSFLLLFPPFFGRPPPSKPRPSAALRAPTKRRTVVRAAIRRCGVFYRERVATKSCLRTV
jgi:hypothetical protein